jgi:hypothetical protein
MAMAKKTVKASRPRGLGTPKRGKAPKGAPPLTGAIDLAIRRAAVDAASSGDNTLVAATSGQRIVVTSCCLIAAGTVTARFESGAGGTALSGQMTLAAGTGFVLPHNEGGWFETASSALLNSRLSGAVSVDGFLNYRKLG